MSWPSLSWDQPQPQPPPLSPWPQEQVTHTLLASGTSILGVSSSSFQSPSPRGQSELTCCASPCLPSVSRELLGQLSPKGLAATLEQAPGAFQHFPGNSSTLHALVELAQSYFSFGLNTF